MYVQRLIALFDVISPSFFVIMTLSYSSPQTYAKLRNALRDSGSFSNANLCYSEGADKQGDS